MLGLLLKNANKVAKNKPWKRDFYQLKDKLLTKYGKPCGTDLQVINYSCWGCSACYSFSNEEWPKCSGDGIYARRYIELPKRLIFGYTFHSVGQQYGFDPRKKHGDCSVQKKYDAIIEGHIIHDKPKKDYGYICFLILALLFDFRIFIKHVNPIRRIVSRVRSRLAYMRFCFEVKTSKYVNWGALYTDDDLPPF